MHELLVDIGNTRVKFATLRGRKLGVMRAIEHAGSVERMLRGMRPALRNASAVTAVSVAGEALERHFARAVRAATGLTVQFIRSTTPLSPLAIGYEQPWRLGADRWVAIAGAFTLARGKADVLVVDIGTALTADLVRRDGQHLGGVIVPGPDLMVRTLLERTRGIRVRTRGLVSTRANARARAEVFGRNTRQGVEWGSEVATAALIERLAGEAARQVGRPVRVLVTGGAAANLRRRLPRGGRWIPNLVLQGLAQFALRSPATR
jgi:type III pantothenate kinase